MFQVGTSTVLLTWCTLDLDFICMCVWVCACMRVRLSQRCSFNSHLVLFASVKICWESAPFQLKQAKVLFFQWSIAIIHVHVHVQIWTRAEKWILTLQFMGPRKAKQEVNFKKPTFSALCTPGTTTKLHQPVTPKKRRAEAHRALGYCDRMHEQTDFSTFSAKKASKGRFLPKNAKKGERNELFQKGRKKGEHLWERAMCVYARVSVCVCEKRKRVWVYVCVYFYFYLLQHYEVVVATSAIICKKGFAPHTGARAIPPTLLDTWLTHDCHSEHTRSPSNLRLGKPARKHHSLLNTQCFGEFTPHQLSLSRLRKIVPEEHHLYSALQAQTSPGIQTYRDAPFPARQTPREHQIAAWVSVAPGRWDRRRGPSVIRNAVTSKPTSRKPALGTTVRSSGCDFGDNL